MDASASTEIQQPRLSPVKRPSDLRPSTGSGLSRRTGLKAEREEPTRGSNARLAQRRQRAP
eukprot:10287414-Alexandrium_andersonii.AAC.1